METSFLLDSILKDIEKDGWYVDFDDLCNRINIPENKRKYVLSKLEADGMIEVLSTKTSLEIRISKAGIVFINESCYSNEMNISKTNESIVSGNNNVIIQGVNKSEILVNSDKKIETSDNDKSYTTLIIIILAILTLIATLIIGWDNILKFFNS